MKRHLFHTLILLVAFFGCWALLARVPWTKMMGYKPQVDSVEKEVGNLAWRAVGLQMEAVKDSYYMAPLDSIVTRLCEANDIERKEIKLHLVNDKMVNAFALPDGHLVVTTALIDTLRHADELAGVLAHELGHVYHHHSMKSLVKEVGLSVLTGTVGGGEQARRLFKHILSTAFTREMEGEADEFAIDVLFNSDINPAPLADFLYRMWQENQLEEAVLEWASTHPNSNKRATRILEAVKKRNEKEKSSQATTSFRPALHATTWSKWKEDLRQL